MGKQGDTEERSKEKKAEAEDEKGRDQVDCDHAIAVEDPRSLFEFLLDGFVIEEGDERIKQTSTVHHGCG